MKPSFILLVVVAHVVLGIALGIILTKNLLLTEWGFVAPRQLFEGETALPIPSLQVMAQDTNSDEAALKEIARYFKTHQEDLRFIFNESDPARLRALFAMYLTHTSHFYGRHAPDFSFSGWLSNPYADCGSYAQFQSQILTALGLRWRQIAISGGTHVFVEALIDGRWEYFDATVNVWVNQSAFDMERRATRVKREFYTPLLDPVYADRFDFDTLQAGQELRVMMPLLGLEYFPKAYLYVYDESENTTTTISQDAGQDQPHQ